MKKGCIFILCIHGYLWPAHLPKTFLEEVKKAKDFENPLADKYQQNEHAREIYIQDKLHEKKQLDFLSNRLGYLEQAAPKKLQANYSDQKKEIDAKRAIYDQFLPKEFPELLLWRQDNIKQYEKEVQELTIKELTTQIGESYEPYKPKPKPQPYTKYTLELNRLGKQIDLQFKKIFNSPEAHAVAADIAKIFNQLAKPEQALSYQIQAIELNKRQEIKEPDLEKKAQLYTERQKQLSRALMYYDNMPEKTQVAKDRIKLALKNVYQLTMNGVSDLVAQQEQNGTFADRMNKGDFGIKELIEGLKNYVRLLKVMGYPEQDIGQIIKSFDFGALAQEHAFGQHPTGFYGGQKAERDFMWYKSPFAYITNELRQSFPMLGLESRGRQYKAGQIVIEKKENPTIEQIRQQLKESKKVAPESYLPASS